jgi:hypothetical protein
VIVVYGEDPWGFRFWSMEPEERDQLPPLFNAHKIYLYTNV